jgi:hypothetical protein
MNADERASISELSPSGDHVFVVRLWLERVPDARTTALWRGRVTYVNTQEEKHVDGIEEALEMVRAVLLQRVGCTGNQ